MEERKWSVAERFRNNKRVKNKIIRALLGALTVIITAGAFGHNPNGKADPMNASLEALKGLEFEQSFLQQMIQHHRSGIEMAKLASDHTSRAELRQFAEK